MKDGDREVLIALDGQRAGKSMREIAEDVFGAERVAAEWSADGGVRLQTRRLVQKARAHANADRRVVLPILDPEVKWNYEREDLPLRPKCSRDLSKLPAVPMNLDFLPFVPLGYPRVEGLRPIGR